MCRIVQQRLDLLDAKDRTRDQRADAKKAGALLMQLAEFLTALEKSSPRVYTALYEKNPVVRSVTDSFMQLESGGIKLIVFSANRDLCFGVKYRKNTTTGAHYRGQNLKNTTTE